MNGTTLSQVGYRRLVGRVRKAVRASVPPESTVLVVSRGDEELTKLPGRVGWHFPQDGRGVYAGHYPSGSEEAVSHLESLRKAGAEYLVFPKTAFWWLEHYPGLGRHLRRCYSEATVQGRRDCRIFDLRTEVSSAASNGVDVPDEARDLAPLRRLADFLDALLPAEEPITLALADPGGEVLLPHRDGEAAGAARFLVIPALNGGISLSRSAISELRRRYRTLAYREHLCVVFDLGRLAADAPAGRRS